MATDASILLGYKPMQTRNPMEMYEAGQRIETNRLAGIMNGLKMDEYKRSVEDADSLRGIVKGFGADTTANTNALYAGGQMKAAGDYAKAQGDLAKDAASTGKTRLEAVGLAMTQHRDAVNMIQSPGDVKQWITAGYNNPDLKPVFERYGTLQESLGKIDANVTNPAQLQQWKLTASTNAETLLKQMSPDANARLTAETSTANNAATNATSRANNSASVGATIRGQNLTDARSRDATSATLTKPFEITGEDGKPVLVQQDKQGNIKPVAGFGPKAGTVKPLTDVQGNATNFAGRMVSASSILDPLELKGVTTADLATMAAGSKWTNFLATPDGRQYQQAEQNWVTANLRKESGAVIGDDEMARERRKYFPIPGDDKKTIQQKQQARKIAEEGMMVQAGPGAKTVANTLEKTGAVPSQSAPAMPSGFKVIR